MKIAKVSCSSSWCFKYLKTCLIFPFNINDQGCTDLMWDYWTNFSMKNWNWKLYWSLGAFLVSLESPQQVRFNIIYFTIFRAKLWKILIFEWNLLLKIQTNCKNWVWEKISWALNVFTLPILEIFNFENVEKIKNVFTLGPMAQATLVVIKVVKTSCPFLNLKNKILQIKS